MSNIKLTLTYEGAEALREFARALPVATENIQLSTEKLYAIYQSVAEDLGVHKQEFESLLSHIKKMQLNATYAIAMLVPNMNKTADRIDDYVAFDPTCVVSLDNATDVGYISHYVSRSTMTFLIAQSFTPDEIAKELDVYPHQISIAYAKDANNTSKMYHELSDAIRHPRTGEMLKAVKGYYISNVNGQEECIYAEYVDSRGFVYSYAKSKCSGDSVLSQMQQDGIFESKTEGLVSSDNGLSGTDTGSNLQRREDGRNIFSKIFCRNKNESIHQALKEVEHKPIELAFAERNEQQIINSISGGDKTDGSCSSLALAYAGNRAGYVVYDFRGGQSCDVFSSRSSIEQIAELEGVNSVVLRGTDDTICVGQLLTNMESGKEYYMATGSHAAVVRFNGRDYQYLELQSGNPSDNGWQSLTLNAMYARFRCRDGRSTEWSNYLIDLDSLQSNTEFLNLLGYINTKEPAQMKGADGYER